MTLISKLIILNFLFFLLLALLCIREKNSIKYKKVYYRKLDTCRNTQIGDERKVNEHRFVLFYVKRQILIGTICLFLSLA